MTLEDLETQVDAFRTLQTHPGWILLCAHMKARADGALAQMRGAKNNDELIKASIEYIALTDLPKAPEMLRARMEQSLHRTLEKK